MTSISINVIKDKDVSSIIQWLKFLKDKKILDFEINPTDFLVEGNVFTTESINKHIGESEKSKSFTYEQALAYLNR